MGALNIWHVLIFAAIVLLLFAGQNKISDSMGLQRGLGTVGK